MEIKEREHFVINGKIMFWEMGPDGEERIRHLGMISREKKEDEIPDAPADQHDTSFILISNTPSVWESLKKFDKKYGDNTE